MPGWLLRLCLFACFWPVAHAAPITQPSQSSRPSFHIVLALPRAENKIEEAFKDYLQRRGINARYSVVQWQDPMSLHSQQHKNLLNTIRQHKPDLIYSWGAEAVLMLAGAYDQPNDVDVIRDIPIIFTEVTDPVASKVLPSLKSHTRNMTGVIHVPPMAMQLNVMYAFRPFQRVAYLLNPQSSSSNATLAALKQLAPTLPFELVVLNAPFKMTNVINAEDVLDTEQLSALLQQMQQQKIDFLYFGADKSLAEKNGATLAQLALQYHLPTFCVTEQSVRNTDCLLGLSANRSATGRFASQKAVQILLEKIPANKIAVDTPPDFALTLNMNSARALEMYPSLLFLNSVEIIEKKSEEKSADK